jgi:16S rRNA (adenine1518-N6/adenine1519-N6)-dimethyltransferase
VGVPDPSHNPRHAQWSMSKGGARSHFANYADLPLFSNQVWSRVLRPVTIAARNINQTVGRKVNRNASPKAGPRKSLGQHFLSDHRTVARIIHAAQLAPDDVVVEIGPGQGVLTRRLVDQVKRVVALELDSELCAALPARLGSPPNLVCIAADARVADIAELVAEGEAYKVVANLPYYAANPIIRRLLETEPKPHSMVVMVQQEVANNMVAAPGKMGILSVATQFYAEASLVCTVPPHAFKPPPKVTSAVVKLVLRNAPAVATGDVGDGIDSFFQVVKAGFSAPRKQLRNSLSHGLAVAPETAGAVLETAGIDGKRRAETLALEEWGCVYHAWEKLKD